MRLFVLAVLLIVSVESFATAFRPEIAVTFDDYPFVTNSNLSAKEKIRIINSILDQLKNENIQATFFANGLHITKEFDQVTKRLVSEGHRLSNHTYSHIRFSSHDRRVVRQEIDKNHRIISKYDNKMPQFFRYPYLDTGSYFELGGAPLKAKNYLSYLNKYNYHIAPITIDSADWAYDRQLQSEDQKYRKAFTIESYVDETLYVLNEGVNDAKLLKIPHVVMFHVNEINDHAFHQILPKISETYTVTSLNKVLEHPFYASYRTNQEVLPQFVSMSYLLSEATFRVWNASSTLFLKNLWQSFLDKINGITGSIYYYFNFLFIVLLVYVFASRRKSKKLATQRLDQIKKSLTVLVPAHNEEAYLSECIEALESARYNGKKEVIIINDCSKDRTAEIANFYANKFGNIRVIHNKKQLGKAGSLNKGLTEVTTELIAVVDGDSIVEHSALEHVGSDFIDPKVDATGGVVFVKFKWHPMHMIYNIQMMYLSLYRLLMSKIRSNILTPGPLSVFKREVVNTVGGFSTDGLCEDLEISVRIQEAGYRLEVNPDAKVGTYFPQNVWFLVKQQLRWASGTLYVLRRKINPKSLTPIQLFVFPIMILGFFNSFVYTPGVVMNLVRSLGELQNEGWMSTFMTWVNHLTILQSWGQVQALWSQLETHHVAALFHSSFYGSIINLSGMIVYFFATFVMFKQFNIRTILGFFFVPVVWLVFSISALFSFKSLFVRHQKNIWKKELRKSQRDLIAA